MSCQELQDLLHDYLAGDLQLDQHQTIELHLSGCKQCVLQVKSYRLTIWLARSLPKCTRLPAAVEERLKQRLVLEGFTKDEG